MKPDNLVAALQSALKDRWKPKASKEDIAEENKTWGIRNFTRFDNNQVGVMRCVILETGIEFSSSASSKCEFFEYQNTTFKEEITGFMNKILKAK